MIGSYSVYGFSDTAFVVVSTGGSAFEKLIKLPCKGVLSETQISEQKY